MLNLAEKKPDSLELDRYRERVYIATIGVLLFAFHLLVGHRNAREALIRDEPRVIIQHLKDLVQADYFMPWLFQENFYTGNPFFLLPYFMIFGSSPQSVRIAVIGMMALTSVFAFLAYVNLFDLRKGILGVLVLLSINSWLVFKEADYTYMALFPAVCLYLFIRWDVKGDKLSFYALSFFSGILFYFKASVAYVMIALVLGKMLAGRKSFVDRLRKELGYRKLLTGSLLFTAGLSPFIAHVALNPEALSLSVGGQSLNLVQNLVIRLEQLTGMLHPTNAFTTGVISLNPISVALGASIVISMAFRQRLDYTVSFLLFFGAFLLTPQISGFMYGHIFTLFPFVPILILTAYEILENTLSGLSSKAPEIIYFALLVILAANISASVVWMEHQETLRTEPVPASHTPRDPSLCENMTNLEPRVITNTHEGAVCSIYDFNVEDIYYTGSRDSPMLTGGYFKSFSRFEIPVRKPESLSIEGKTTLLLADELPCGPTEGCYNASYLTETLELEEDSSEQKIILNGKKYSLYHLRD